MKTTLFLLILFSFTNISIINAQWVPCNNGLNMCCGISCFIVDGNNTYTGTAGVYMTTDNGENWTDKNKGLKDWQGNYPILSLAISGNNIFAGTIGNGIFLSTDKGDNWERKSNGLAYMAIPDTIFLENIGSIIINGNNIFAGTYGVGQDTIYGFYLSTDNGNNWTPKNNGLPQFKETIKDIYSLAISGNNIFAGTRYGVYMTSDNGDNWSAKNKDIENLKVFSLAINGNNIYAGTVGGGVFLSTDNGDNWKYIGLSGPVVDAIIVKGNYIFAAGGGFYISSNNGKNWTSNLLDEGIPCIIINGDYIFAGSGSSGVYRAKLSDLGITDVKEPEQTNEIKIFPNPTSGEIRLKFNSPVETTVQLNVFDLLGNMVLSQKLQSTEGTNEKTINCEKLPQGYYYVKININEIVETVPLVIVK